MSKPRLIHGDCLQVLGSLEDNSVDAIVTDPPAGIAFMGKSWDKDKGGRAYWIAWMAQVASECLRVIKPGGHALVWSIPRTSHWTGMAWEDAGWDPRDKIYHAFGSGFPKSHDISKAIDRGAGAERDVVGTSRGVAVADNKGFGGIARGGVGIVQKACDIDITAPATPEAAHWQGWGTALKPAVEEWWLFRKPFKGSVASNVLEWGTGGIHVDACRVEHQSEADRASATPQGRVTSQSSCLAGKSQDDRERSEFERPDTSQGRWPANLIHSGDPDVVGLFPKSNSSATPRNRNPKADRTQWRNGGGEYSETTEYGDTGSAARFFKNCPDDNPEDDETRRLFYCAKASKRDRNEGLPEGTTSTHPTVKPTELMRYLCRLITPPGGTILDPFMGSGSTGKAAVLEGFAFVGIEQDAGYIEIARARIHAAQDTPTQGSPQRTTSKVLPLKPSVWRGEKAAGTEQLTFFDAMC